MLIKETLLTLKLEQLRQSFFLFLTNPCLLIFQGRLVANRDAFSIIFKTRENIIGISSRVLRKNNIFDIILLIS